MQGLHLTADLRGCRCAPSLMADADLLRRHVEQIVAAAGLAVVGRCFHAFAPGGVTGVLLLAESHVAVHTWPELAQVTLDVYVCDHQRDNASKAQAVFDRLVAGFAPESHVAHRVERGRPNGGALALEWQDPDSAYGFRLSPPIERIRSPHQQVEIFDSRRFGRLFRLDGRYMTSEGDEFCYHEPMVHPAALAIAAPAAALILGGGDGGACEELLKHPSIATIDLVELDAVVVDVARRHLGTVHQGAFDDPRVQLHIEDGDAFVARCTRRYDLIVLDLTDPDTVAAGLYSARFFARLAGILAPGGLVSLHLGSPVFAAAQVRTLLARLRTAFRVVRPAGIVAPLYGGYWAIAIAGNEVDPAAIPPATLEARWRERGLAGLRYYHPALQAALFVLPAFVAGLATGADDADGADDGDGDGDGNDAAAARA